MSGREGSQAEVGAEEALLAPSQQYTQFLQWQAQQQEAAPQYAVDGGTPHAGWASGATGLPAGRLSTAGTGISGTVAPSSRVGLMAGLGFPSPDVSSENGLLKEGSQSSNIWSTLENNSRVLEAKHIAPFESNKNYAWSVFK